MFIWFLHNTPSTLLYKLTQSISWRNLQTSSIENYAAFNLRVLAYAINGYPPNTRHFRLTLKLFCVIDLCKGGNFLIFSEFSFFIHRAENYETVFLF